MALGEAAQAAALVIRRAGYVSNSVRIEAIAAWMVDRVDLTQLTLSDADRVAVELRRRVYNAPKRLDFRTLAWEALIAARASTLVPANADDDCGGGGW